MARAGEKLLAVQPKLRAKSAGRVVELLLGDDVVSPARAAKAARLSDRGAAAVRSAHRARRRARTLRRPNFRLYGL